MVRTVRTFPDDRLYMWQFVWFGLLPLNRPSRVLQRCSLAVATVTAVASVTAILGYQQGVVGVVLAVFSALALLVSCSTLEKCYIDWEN